jgi:prepilin-type N-terminal cleavage/methylation domain-containing protein
MIRHNQRSGLTLLEVVVALAIFGFSIVAIFQLINLGNERAEDVRAQTRTSLRCQAKMAELMIDASQLVDSEFAPFTDTDTKDGDMQWKVKAEAFDDTAKLFTVTVTVKAEIPGGRVVESSLTRMVMSSAHRGTTFDPEIAPKVGVATTTPEGSQP